MSLGLISFSVISLFVDQLRCIVNYSTVIYHDQVHCTLRQQAMLDFLIQYSNMVMRLSGLSSIFVSKSLLGIVRQKKQKKKCNFHPKSSDSCSNIDNYIKCDPLN